MRVAVIGNGGREHALAWKLARHGHQVVVMPGNGGTACFEQAAVAPTDLPGVRAACRELRVELVIVGPEGPLAAGLVDSFTSFGIPILGPTSAAARLESSKAWAKDFMARHGVATATFVTCTRPEEARPLIERLDGTVVVKHDGLAAGKGVIVCANRAQAWQAIATIQEHFGSTAPFVVEERLTGPELSLIVLTDGETLVPLTPAQDHKRLLDGDLGPNTGGMGAYCPVPWCTPELMAEIERQVTGPTLAGLATEGLPYRGFLYFGLMLTPAGPRLLEYNVRLGDPEAEVVLPALSEDLAELALACCAGRLRERPLPAKTEPVACFVDVVLTAAGYPGSYQTGLPISGLSDLPPDVLVFHAGTAPADDGRGADDHGGTDDRDGADDPRVVTAGGRVLNVVGQGISLPSAAAAAYAACRRIHFEGCHYRRDIAARTERTA
jgi:phosphoribosylamine--glycine ligase